MGKQMKKILAGLVLAGIFMTGCGEEDMQYYQKAQQYMEKGEYSLALENYNKAIMEDEELQQSYRGAGIANMKMGDYEKAEDLFLRGLRESDGTIGDMELDLSYYLGETQICLGKYEEALETYTNVLEVYEDETDAYFYRGSVYLQNGQHQKAEEDFEKAAQGKDAFVLYGIYEAYLSMSMGDTEGQKYLEEIVKLKGKTGEELFVMGKAYYSMGDVQKAIEYLKKAEKEEEQQAVFYLGTVYGQLGDYESAMKYYNKYKKANGLTYDEYCIVSDCMLNVRDYTAALELNRFMRDSAGKLEIQDLLFDEIVIYEQSNDYASAREKAEEYVALYPEDTQGQKEYQFLLTR